MAIYKFRFTIEDQEEISRDLELRSTQTFEDLHHALHKSLGFDGTPVGSFFMSDDNWKKGKEITFRELSEEEQTRISPVSKSRLCDFIIDPHQKIYYVHGSDTIWAFHIELFKIIPKEDILISYPHCSRIVGESPRQYGLSGAEAIPIPDEFDEEDLDEEMDEDREEEILGTDEADIPEGEERDTSILASGDDSDEMDDDLETADEELLDDEGADSDEF